MEMVRTMIIEDRIVRRYKMMRTPGFFLAIKDTAGCGEETNTLMMTKHQIITGTVTRTNRGTTVVITTVAGTNSENTTNSETTINKEMWPQPVAETTTMTTE